MRKQANKAAIIAAVWALFSFTGCKKAAADVTTIYDSDRLKIEQQGANTYIYDLAAGTDYSFTRSRQRKKAGTAAQIREARTTTDTKSLTIQTVYSLIIVTVKSTGETLYISR